MRDVHFFRRRWVRVVVQRLDAFNQRHPWDHNGHFHRWVLRRVPVGARTALDVGCGGGLLLSRLAGRVSEVTGIDRDAGMVAAAAARPLGPDVTVRHAQLDDEVAAGTTYEVVTMIAVLHHLDLDHALAALARLVDPGGRLLVVGLARPQSAADWAVDVASALVNPVVGMVRHPRAVAPGPRNEPAVPMRDPRDTFAEIRAAAVRHLPGARLRRRLFFRYTLEWTAPGRIGSSQSMW